MSRRRRNSYVPTESQIREACESIQEGWSDKERRRRRYGNSESVPRYTIPEYDVMSLVPRPRGPVRGQT